MEYQKIMSLLDIASNIVPKFSTKFNTLSNLWLVNSKSTHLNDSLIDQVHERKWKAFLDISHINISEFSVYFSD